MSEPVTSPGIRSGVNWTRLKSSDSAAENDRTSRVLATPGGPSRSTWPPHSRAIASPATVPSWPTTALPTSARSRAKAARDGSPSSGAYAVAGAGTPGGGASGTPDGAGRSALSSTTGLSLRCGVVLFQRVVERRPGAGADHDQQGVQVGGERDEIAVLLGQVVGEQIQI